jgi:hypothetical protein
MEFDAPISVEAHTKVWAKPIRSSHWLNNEVEVNVFPSGSRDHPWLADFLVNSHVKEFAISPNQRRPFSKHRTGCCDA